MSIIGLLVALILVGLVFWAVRAIGAAFAIPQQIITVIVVILVFIIVLWILQSLGVLSGGPVLRLR